MGTFGICPQLNRNVEQADGDDQEGDEACLGGTKRNERVAEHQQAVAGDQEHDGRHVRKQLGLWAVAAQVWRQHYHDGQRANRDRQVAVAPVRLAEPRCECPDRQGRERDFDGKLKDQEDFGHCGRIAYLRIFQGRTTGFIGSVSDKMTAGPGEN